MIKNERAENIESSSKHKYVYGNLVCDKSYFRPLINKSYWDNWLTIWEGNKVESFTSHTKTNFNWVKKIQNKTKTLEENIGETNHQRILNWYYEVRV